MNINPFEILKNAGKIQEQMGMFQEKLGDIHATGSSGGGMVEITLNGRMEVQSVKISKDAIADGDLQMLGDLVMAAFNSAMEKIREAINREMGTMAGMQIPGFTS
ncbi:MAG: YbaB/EbfC family nucleoid-associated protein [Treponema sp.]|nr:YbaB/EbfC family nucleoid-associated protein [Treponema sp.]